MAVGATVATAAATAAGSTLVDNVLSPIGDFFLSGLKPASTLEIEEKESAGNYINIAIVLVIVLSLSYFTYKKLK